MDDWYDELWDGMFDTPIHDEVAGEFGVLEEIANQDLLDWAQFLAQDNGIELVAQPSRGPRVVLMSQTDGFIYSEAHTEWARTAF